MASIAAISWAGPAHPPGVEWQEGQGPPPGVAWKGNSRNGNDCGKFEKISFKMQYVLTFLTLLFIASIPSWMIAGNRIQGGTDAQAPIPWQVAVRFNGNQIVEDQGKLEHSGIKDFRNEISCKSIKAFCIK